MGQVPGYDGKYEGGGGIAFAIANQQLLELEDVVPVVDERNKGDSDEK